MMDGKEKWVGRKPFFFMREESSSNNIAWVDMNNVKSGRGATREMKKEIPEGRTEWEDAKCVGEREKKEWMKER